MKIFYTTHEGGCWRKWPARASKPCWVKFDAIKARCPTNPFNAYSAIKINKVEFHSIMFVKKENTMRDWDVFNGWREKAFVPFRGLR